MQVTAETLARMSGREVNDNMRSVIAGLALAGVGAGLNRQHRLAMYLAQLGHESEWFKYDREIWGPTEAQKRYEGRKDLGNTEPGDGSKFRGHTAAQITGRANTTDFRDWCRRIDPRGIAAPKTCWAVPHDRSAAFVMQYVASGPPDATHARACRHIPVSNSPESGGISRFPLHRWPVLC